LTEAWFGEPAVHRPVKARPAAGVHSGLRSCSAQTKVDTFVRGRDRPSAGDRRGWQRYLSEGMASWATGRGGGQALKPRRLVRVECGRETTGPEKGWRAVLASGVEDELEVGVYCPACAEREFGEDEAG
jgi:hypothetical protein